MTAFMLSDAFLDRVQGLFYEELQASLPTVAEVTAALEAADKTALENFTRRYHGIAGAAGLVGFHPLTGLFHLLEELLTQATQDTLPPPCLTALKEGLVERAHQSALTAVKGHAEGHPLRADHALLKELESLLKPGQSTGDAGEKPNPVRVLVVDDDRVSLFVIEEVLKTGGYEVLSTMDPEKTVQLMKDTQPDLIILDVVLGQTNGFEVARRIRRDSAGELTPIILVSVKAELGDRIQGFQAGATDYLAKPFAPAELLARVSAILERTRLFKNLALRDGLTGAFNHRYLQERLTEEINRYKRTHKPFCIAMLDLDHFKAVNDRYGHQSGDRVLQGFVALLKQQLRDMDVVARYGGEEFVIIMLESTPEDALRALERVRETVASRELVPGIRVTFSGGVSMAPRDGLDKDALVALADKRLYEAKSAGRNRIVPAAD